MMKVVLPALIIVAVILGLSLILAHSSCAKPDVQFVNTGVVKTNDDPALYVAVRQAKDSLDKFIDRIEHPQPGDSDFGVQTAFNSAEGPEHMWVRVSKYSKGVFTGKLNDEPNDIPGMHKGQTVDVKKDDVSDWIYASNGQQVGGFTIKVLQSERQGK